ncbi:MFS transporter [Aeoliella mucimassa]|uniref:MFS transporter n=1 Tax=Aeoliella mucimassa TaxID=2527972 RepID=UPI0011A76241|nr:MFS transporter [Aeoliella mucimassa]
MSATSPEPNSTPVAESSAGAWSWVPSLYFAEAVPFELVMTVSLVFYKGMEVSNTAIAAYTSLLYLPWMIKPIWSPLVDVLWTKRSWIVAMQLTITLGMAGIAMCCGSTSFFMLTLACFWVLAFASATHDIAADGFYMIGMSAHQQAIFVGIRSTFYRLGIIASRGLLVMLAGKLIETSMPTSDAWSRTFYLAAGAFLIVAAYHAIMLPRREKASSDESAEPILHQLVHTIDTFVSKPGVLIGICYILLYRFAEAQLAKVAPLFMLDDRASGGLGLTETDTGFIYGTAGVLMLVIGGILGGLVVAKQGLGKWLLLMAVAINLPNLVYIALAYWLPTNIWVVTGAVAIEQFGYGFGFAGYMLYMLYLAKGAHQTSHFALCTGIMATGMMLPGMISGAIQEWIGYQWFFVWVMVATVPSFLVTMLVPIDPNFGKASAE